MWGVVYEIPDHLIRRESAKPRTSLDAIEGENRNYRKVSIQLRWADGSELKEPVITYVGLARRSGIQTNLEYVQHILAGLDEHKIDPEYVSYVKARITANNPGLSEAIGAPTGSRPQ